MDLDTQNMFNTFSYLFAVCIFGSKNSEQKYKIAIFIFRTNFCFTQEYSLKNLTKPRNTWYVFVVPFSSRSLALKSSWKSHQMIPFFRSKRGIGWKDHHLSEIWQCFHSNNDVDDLRAREREEKGTTNSRLSDDEKWTINKKVWGVHKVWFGFWSYSLNQSRL